MSYQLSKMGVDEHFALNHCGKPAQPRESSSARPSTNTTTSTQATSS